MPGPRPTTPDRPVEATWIDDHYVPEFTLASTHHEPLDDALPVWKPRWAVEQLIERAPEWRDANVVELGVFGGGSVALLTQLARPRRVLAVDLLQPEGSPLDAWIRERDLGDVVHTCWGLDQSDADGLRTAVDRVMGGEPLDLVVDDASHDYEPSRRSFEVLFPFVRPGGHYLIEDWNGVELALAGLADRLDPTLDRAATPDREGWARALTAALDEPDHHRHPFAAELARRGVREAFATGRSGEPPSREELERLVADLPPSTTTRYFPLSRLIAELVLALTRHGAIAGMHVGPIWVDVERGPDELGDRFALDDLIDDRFGVLGD